jgi:Transglutaminase-like superfamily
MRVFFTALAAGVSATTTNDGSAHTRQMMCRQGGRSNITHLAWKGSSCNHWQTVEEAKQEAYNYLRDNVMAFDLPFLQTLGFHENNRTDVDGLADGLIGPTIEYAIQAKIKFAYTDALPRHIWNEYVLNYAILNEGRTNIRRLLWERLIDPLFLTQNNDTDDDTDNEHRTVPETVKILNTKMWKMLAPVGCECIVFVSGQAPAILDPMSVLTFGFASCTGLAVLFVQALRAAGVPARVAGTAAWNGVPEKGNHNWVEVWTGAGPSSSSSSELQCNECGWSFLEPSPAQDIVDTVDRNPCERWFCQPDRMAGGTEFYASRLEHYDTTFPIAWEWSNHDVPAVDRTNYYQSVCSQCGTSAKTE